MVPPADPERTRLLSVAYDEIHRQLLVTWGDGANRPIPYSLLRKSCPCAICAGEMGRPGRFDVDPELRAGEDELADIHLVGNYALGLRWADGHDTGMHTFERLRAVGDSHAAGQSAAGV